tara:strand:+ start:597 stop:956 length:360 start_codon:yes stop_codon:yes gene_type:complete
VRRTRLIWFACGAAVSALVLSISQLALADNKETSGIVLIISAPDILPAGSDLDDLNSLSLTTGSMIRDCGYEQFEMRLSSHHGIAYEVPVTPENRESLKCVVQAIRDSDEAISFSFEAR